VISRQTTHLSHLMDDLLDVARVISGKVLLSRRQIDLGALLARVAETLRVTGEGRQHTISVEPVEAWIDADPTRIEQVVNNLLTNAIKYTPPGGRITLRVRAEGNTAVLQVADNGLGIPPSLLPRIFELFVQGERTLDRRAGGLGIGLTLVRRIVELHGGHVSVDSSPSGSCFEVRLDRIPAPPPMPEAPRAAGGRALRVLVVDDNADALTALRSMLSLDGHDVLAAVDGEEGLATLVSKRPDAAVVDIGLPLLDGYGVAQRARAAGYPGRLIALSGYGQGADVRRALAAGFDAHLVKPVVPTQLKQLLEAH
jgi:CheY-like chemotaxis protein